jgi:hypothetical protein
MALRLYAVTFLEGLAPVAVDGTAIVPVRDLAAVVEEAPYVMSLPDDEALARHHEVTSATLARAGAVLPAPAGTVFRSVESLRQWLELHYVALNDALAYVEDRVEARIHVARADASEAEREAGTDLAAASTEIFRVLRRQAVASFALRTEHVTGLALTSAFLVERELWKEFTALARTEGERQEGIDLSITGPWPPYDFVRIHFGG